MNICEFITIYTSYDSYMFRPPIVAIFSKDISEKHQNQFTNIKYYILRKGLKYMLKYVKILIKFFVLNLAALTITVLTT